MTARSLLKIARRSVERPAVARGGGTATPFRASREDADGAASYHFSTVS
jgi:hypothetical protein